MAVFPAQVRRLVDMVLIRMDAEQLTKEIRSIAPFLIPFLKMTCIYFVLWLDQGSFPAAFVKCLPMLSLIWFVCLLGVSDSHMHQYNRKILTALVLCCIGDFSLVWAEDEKFFLLGLGCFAIAHVIYSHAFGWQPFGLKELVFSLTLGLPITAAILSYIEGPMFYSVLVYGLILVLMMWRALARFNLKGEIPWRKIYAACGATLFIVSDITLAVNKFCWPVVGERYIIMVTYYAAQLCISLSVMNSCLVHPAPPRAGLSSGKFRLNGTVGKEYDVMQNAGEKSRNVCSNGTGYHGNDVVQNGVVDFRASGSVFTTTDTAQNGAASHHQPDYNTDNVVHGGVEKNCNGFHLNGTAVDHSKVDSAKHSKSD